MDQGRRRAAGTFFGRRKAKPLTDLQQGLYEGLLPALRIDIGKPAPGELSELFPDPVRSVMLEIGFGGGEHLCNQAIINPATGYIGAEPFINGLAKALVTISGEDLQNIRLHDEDAVRLLDWLPPRSLDRLYLLYPDPWPKKRHWKRRFVNRENLARFARVLKPGGEFRFASDIDHYVNWTLEMTRQHGGFTWLASNAADWKEPWDGWVRTRYEAKAYREGRSPAYLRFVRN